VRQADNRTDSRMHWGPMTGKATRIVSWKGLLGAAGLSIASWSMPTSLIERLSLLSTERSTYICRRSLKSRRRFKDTALTFGSFRSAVLRPSRLFGRSRL
jgi:hypothetical protein